jgi:hypothetical protein
MVMLSTAPTGAAQQQHKRLLIRADNAEGIELLAPSLLRGAWSAASVF